MSTRTPRPPDTLFTRRTAVAATAGLILLILFFQPQFRAGEAGLAAFTNSILGAPTKWVPGSDAFYVGIGTSKVFAFQLVAGCSTALLILPLMALAAVYVHFGRVRVAHMLAGLVLCCVSMLVVNMIRLAIVGLYTQHSGRAGFEWAHTIVGSLVVLAGGSAVLILFSRWIRRASTVAVDHEPVRVLRVEGDDQ